MEQLCPQNGGFQCQSMYNIFIWENCKLSAVKSLAKEMKKILKSHTFCNNNVKGTLFHVASSVNKYVTAVDPTTKNCPGALVLDWRKTMPELSVAVGSAHVTTAPPMLIRSMVQVPTSLQPEMTGRISSTARTKYNILTWIYNRVWITHRFGGLGPVKLMVGPVRILSSRPGVWYVLAY